jgi:hypothetical protein
MLTACFIISHKSSRKKKRRKKEGKKKKPRNEENPRFELNGAKESFVNVMSVAALSKQNIDALAQPSLAFAQKPHGIEKVKDAGVRELCS